MPDGVRTKYNEVQKRERSRFIALLRPLVLALSLPLKWLFKVVNRRQRQVLVRIPGVLAVYHSVSRLLLSARSEDGIPCAEVNGLKMYMDPEEHAGRAGAFVLTEMWLWTSVLTGVISHFLRPPCVEPMAESLPSSLTPETLLC